MKRSLSSIEDSSEISETLDISMISISSEEEIGSQEELVDLTREREVIDLTNEPDVIDLTRDPIFIDLTRSKLDPFHKMALSKYWPLDKHNDYIKAMGYSIQHNAGYNPVNIGPNSVQFYPEISTLHIYGERRTLGVHDANQIQATVDAFNEMNANNNRNAFNNRDVRQIERVYVVGSRVPDWYRTRFRIPVDGEIALTNPQLLLNAVVQNSDDTAMLDISEGKFNYIDLTTGKMPTFSMASYLTSIRLPYVLKEVGDVFGNVLRTLKELDLGDCLTSISANAFNGASMLSSISIPSTLESIGRSAFLKCRSLTSISIPSRVTLIGEDTFRYCGLRSLDMNQVHCNIGRSCFSENTNLTAIRIEGSVSFGEGVFSLCSSLRTVDMSRATMADESLGYFGDLVFNECRSLTGVTLPKGVITLGKAVFSSCQSIQSISIPSTVTKVRRGCFSGCTALTHVDAIGLVKIGKEAFYDCSLTSMPASRGLKAIGNYAFARNNITSIDLTGAPLKRVGVNAFDEIARLVSIKVNAPANMGITRNHNRNIVTFAIKVGNGLQTLKVYDTVSVINGFQMNQINDSDEVVFHSSDGIVHENDISDLGCSSVVIGDDIHSIDKDAMIYDRDAESITIPMSVKNIQAGAFNNCESLNTLYSNNMLLLDYKRYFLYCNTITWYIEDDDGTYEEYDLEDSSGSDN